MADETCGAERFAFEKVLTCDEQPGHDDPTDDAPQGTPHKDSSQVDSLTGDPWPWWA